ncbi:MAG: DUF418 domain-containing protein [Planctomycetota bacterium]
MTAAERIEPAKRARVVGFDVARCLAILSMVYVNFEIVMAPGSSDAKDPEWLRSLASMFEGNASALFVTLAGCGLVMLRRRDVILRRALLLLVFGYVWQLLWPGDILHYYAFYLAVGASCLDLSARWLWLLAAASIGGWLMMFTLLDYGAGWQWSTLDYADFWSLRGQLRNLLFNGWHPLFPWLAFLFAGMALARSQIHIPSRRRLALVASALVYAGAWLASSWLSGLADTRSIVAQFTQWYGAPDKLWGMSSIPPGPLYVLSAGGVAIFVLALCLEVTSWPRVAAWTAPLARTGQLALTFYLGHILVLFFLVEPLQASLMASFEMLPLSYSAVTALLFGVGAMVFAVTWRGQRGPLEWLMRRLCG